MAQTLPLRCCLILGLLVPGAASAQGVRYTDLFDKLALGAGETACEIGAGEGQMTLAAAERVGVELPGEYRQMTSDARSGDLLPEHLVAQQRVNGEGD